MGGEGLQGASAVSNASQIGQGGWPDTSLLLSVVPELLIGLSCLSIATALFLFTFRRRDVRTGWVAVPFAVLLVLYAFFNLFLAWSGNRALGPNGVTSGVFEALLAVVGAVSVWPLVLHATRQTAHRMEQMQSIISRLEHEVGERVRAEEELQKSRESLRQLALYQEQIKEDERKRIAREIHDDLGQNLMALRIDVSLLHARTGRTHPLLNEKVSQVLAQIDTSIKAVRVIINNLRPAVLDLGLHAAIEWQLTEFERRTGIACELDVDDAQSERILDDSRATALFRILQESLSNVARHAQASMVHISLRRAGNKIIMLIADNGIGLYPACRRKPNSFGLLGIGERIGSLGGDFTVDSKEGEGTVLRISIPVEQAVNVA